MSQVIEAVFQRGAFRPLGRLEGIAEASRVRLVVETLDEPASPIPSQTPTLAELVRECTANLSEDTLMRLPHDGAVRHDDYINNLSRVHS